MISAIRPRLLLSQAIPPSGCQAREIIAFILDDPDPRLAETRERLRTWVDTYPGSPARALLEHVIETCSQTNAQRRLADTAAPVISHRAVPN